MVLSEHLFHNIFREASFVSKRFFTEIAKERLYYKSYIWLMDLKQVSKNSKS